ncbi:MAG: type II toxin-antitoxin system RelE/ParE family toxin [Desulfurivibrionaceae bacterium]
MVADLILVAEAHQDISEAYSWYDDQRLGLGEEFLSCVDACLQAICRMPEQCPVVHEEYRRALVRRFPYVVFYEYDGARVTVFAIFHTARNPNKWRKRLA